MFASLINDNSYTWIPGAWKVDTRGNVFLKADYCVASATAHVGHCLTPLSVSATPYWCANDLVDTGVASTGSAYLASTVASLPGYIGIPAETIASGGSGWFQIGGYVATWYNGETTVSMSNTIRWKDAALKATQGTDFSWRLNECGWAAEAATGSYSAMYLYPKICYGLT